MITYTDLSKPTEFNHGAKKYSALSSLGYWVTTSKEKPLISSESPIESRPDIRLRIKRLKNLIPSLLRISSSQVSYKQEQYFISTLSADECSERNLENSFYVLPNIRILYENHKVSTTFQRLKDICQEVDEDDNCLMPSKDAFSRATSFLTKIYILLGDSFPLGYASPDSKNGIDLIWKSSTTKGDQVRLNFPASKDGAVSLYCRRNSSSNLVKDIQPNQVAEFLMSIV